jgi:hypothetical protein
MTQVKYRRFTHLHPLPNGGTDEQPIEPEDLKKGDYFKIYTDDPKDHLYGRNIIYTAASDWDPKGKGPGGNIQVLVQLPPEGKTPDPDIFK